MSTGTIGTTETGQPLVEAAVPSRDIYRGGRTVLRIAEGGASVDLAAPIIDPAVPVVNNYTCTRPDRKCLFPNTCQFENRCTA